MIGALMGCFPAPLVRLISVSRAFQGLSGIEKGESTQPEYTQSCQTQE